MAKPTFTNAQLVTAWRKHAETKPKGTRRNVVTDLMKELGIEDTKENRKRVYNNVTQRLRMLTTHGTSPLTFPSLSPGKKGAPRTDKAMKDLQSILDGTDSEADAPA